MNDPRLSKEQRRERVRQRVKLQFDEDKYEYYPGVEPPDYYNNDVRQLVAIYVRVSTDDPRQTTSFEIQRQYYEEFVTRHPNWVLVGIYADEGISGTSLKHRDQFNRMIEDCRAGKITLIICKSVSRFARNVVDFLGMVRMLSEHNPPIGVFFEAENIFSLNETAQMALSFQATMAEEESRNKSRSMETSLRMRLDHGLLLTPKLLGFMHDDEGHLIPDPRTRHLPKLIFYMYLYGYTTTQIAEALTFVGQRTYRGNIRWQPAVISYVLHNERYCGDVFTRKTYTQDVLTHRKLKNRGQRPRSRYLDTHEAIISRDDFIAVQHRLNNARFGSKSILPELMVIPQGLLRGFVIINPRWGAFQAQDYQYNETGGKEKALDHPLYPLLHDEPNPEMTAFSFRETLMTHLLLWGNGYAQIIRNGRGDVVALYPLMPDRMAVDRDARGRIYYEYTRSDSDVNTLGKKSSVLLLPEDVFHIPGLGFDGLVGYSPIAMAKHAVGLGLACDEYGASFYQNGAQPGGVLEHPGVVKNPQRVRDSWNAIYQGAKNAHKVAILEEGMRSTTRSTRSFS